MALTQRTMVLFFMILFSCVCLSQSRCQMPEALQCMQTTTLKFNTSLDLSATCGEVDSLREEVYRCVNDAIDTCLSDMIEVFNKALPDFMADLVKQHCTDETDTCVPQAKAAEVCLRNKSSSYYNNNTWPSGGAALANEMRTQIEFLFNSQSQICFWRSRAEIEDLLVCTYQFILNCTSVDFADIFDGSLGLMLSEHTAQSDLSGILDVISNVCEDECQVMFSCLTDVADKLWTYTGFNSTQDNTTVQVDDDMCKLAEEMTVCTMHHEATCYVILDVMFDENWTEELREYASVCEDRVEMQTDPPPSDHEHPAGTATQLRGPILLLTGIAVIFLLPVH